MSLLTQHPSKNYAVVINANAGRVTDKLTNQLRTIVPKNRLFLTQSQLHARDVIEHCISQDVDAIFAGGGDGTIVDVINNVQDFSIDDRPSPAVGALRLGTGNALASWLGAPKPMIFTGTHPSARASSLRQTMLPEPSSIASRAL